MKITELVKTNPEGFSIKVSNLTVVKATNGVFVSITNNKVVLKDLDSEFNKLLKVANALSIEEIYIGYWEGFLDISIKVDTLSLAVEIGELFNQKAVYDAFLDKTWYLEDIK